MVDQITAFGRAMREAYSAGVGFEEAWEASLRGCGEGVLADSWRAAHHHGAGASALHRAPKQALCANPQLSARGAARMTGMSIGTDIEARRRLVEAAGCCTG
jgi:hypothetical protein